MLHTLIVERQLQQRKRLNKLVQKMGHIVVGEVQNRDEALALMEQGWPTVLLADMLQPEDEGLMLVRQVYEQRIPIVAIMMGESRKFDDARLAMQAGAIDYLPKPVKEAELAQVLSRAEERVVYFHAAHRAFVRAQQFFDSLQTLRPYEIIQEQADIIRRLQSFEEGRQGERLGLLRMFSAKWHDVLRRNGIGFEEPGAGMQEEAMIAHLHQMSSFWLEHTAASAAGSTKRKRDVRLSVKLAGEYIKEHYMERLTPEEISKKFGMSPSYFRMQIKSYTGYSFVGYINYLRVEKAKELLLQPNLKVYEIAREVGYETLQYFNRVFKKTLQMSPIEYRKKLGIY
ncbi:helix-turn-helix domain-containing protein [Paenibacillus sp. GCM10027626]|uniref:helix-turn-helix domain-containing protein n=1 Tax=Paenibacillus sp. GCM10027626 TaxID=3273411 RepID=UPI00363BC829